MQILVFFKVELKSVAVIAVWLLAASCSSHQNQAAPGAAGGLSANISLPDYGPRIGVGVRTGSRACIAIRNSTLAPGAQITLVSAIAPQSFTPATISAISPTPCPVTNEVDPAASNYNVDGSTNQLPKLTPLIAVARNPSVFNTNNNNVQADLDQNGKTETFRACSSADGIHLTVWSGAPLTGAILWRGYYYEAGNPGTAPACIAQEITGQ